jgi:ferredoxin
MSERHPRNVDGRYYVDTSCVHCDLCHEIAPDHFTQGTDGEGFVSLQPVGSEQEALCHHAKTNCPVGAIQDDGMLSAK